MFQGVLQTEPGGLPAPNPAMPVFQPLSSNPGCSQPAAGFSVVYFHLIVSLLIPSGTHGVPSAAVLARSGA